MDASKKGSLEGPPINARKSNDHKTYIADAAA